MKTENKTEMTADSVIVADPAGVLQVDADKWGILYNPGTDFSFAVNPMGIFIWNQLKDNRLTLKEIRRQVDEHFIDIPDSVEADISRFITKLVEIDLARLEKP